jgi:hypothetical protein
MVDGFTNVYISCGFAYHIKNIYNRGKSDRTESTIPAKPESSVSNAESSVSSPQIKRQGLNEALRLIFVIAFFELVGITTINVYVFIVDPSFDPVDGFTNFAEVRELAMIILIADS